MNIRQHAQLLDEVVTSTNSDFITLKASEFKELCTGYALTLNVVVDTPAAVTFDSGVAASLIEQDITYTAVTRGSAGNSITIAYTGGATAGAEVVTVTGNAISIQIETAVSTATQVKAAFDAVPAAVALATATISGTAGDAQVIVAATPLAGGVNSEVDADANSLAIPSHGLTTGLKGQLTTTGTLPTGVTTGVDYFVIVVDDNSIKLASSLVNALAGTPINLTSQGTSAAVNTFTATSLAGATYKVQVSTDSVNWVDLAAASNITASTTVLSEKLDPMYDFLRVVYTITAGRMSIQQNMSLKGY